MVRDRDKFWTIVSRHTKLTSKLLILGILFSLIYIKILEASADFKIPIMPNEIYLSISLIFVVYIWVVESVDTQKRLLSQNELKNLQRRLRDEQVNTISSLILSQEVKDPYTYGHTARVTQYAGLLARKLDLPQEIQDVLIRAAKLHDIGKIGVDELLLAKVAKLSKDELEKIRQHAELGYSILEPLEFLEKERVLVYQHHEHYDGTGYPNRLKGDDILLGARILAICDFYDAVSSDRPYRKAFKETEIINELKKNKGKQFDPKLADLLLELIEKKDEELRRIAQSAR